MSEEEVKEVVKTAEEKAIERATAFGWRPDGELDAVEFLAKGNEFHIDMKEQVAALKKDNQRVYKIIAEHITNTSKKEYEDRSRALDAEIAQAKAEGDADKAVELVEQKATLKPPEPPEDPRKDYLETWFESQTWKDNRNMMKDAIGFYNAEMYELGEDDPEKIIPLVEKRIKELHKDYFEPVNPNRDKPSGDGKSKAKGGDEIDLDDLDEDERAHIQQFIDMGMDKKRLINSIQKLRK